MAHEQRIIIHVDMDAFFAAIEQLDNPEYRGRPVVVGADPKGGKGRGVVSTCSYEARRYGIGSAQPISEAYRRCPHAVFLPVRMARYKEVSDQVRAVLEEFTPVVEQVSIDEAFLDVTGSQRLFGSAREIAAKIRARMREGTGLTASLGVAPNKMLAKIASDLDKPNGLVVVEPDEVQRFLRPLDVGRLWGVGEKTAEALRRMGIRTVGRLADYPRAELAGRFGKQGDHLWRLAHGMDERPVEESDEVKSVSNEHTFEEDTDDVRMMTATLMRLCEKVAYRLRRGGHSGRTVTSKVRFEDFTTVTRATTLSGPVDQVPDIFQASVGHLKGLGLRGRKVRLLGVAVSNLEVSPIRQTHLFEPAAESSSERYRRLGEAIDAIKGAFGEDALRYGTGLEEDEGGEPDQ